MSIYLIRHAQSLGNVNGKTESHASIPLTEFGHEQAQKLVDVLPPAKQIFISPFLRTRLTAEPILFTRSDYTSSFGYSGVFLLIRYAM